MEPQAQQRGITHDFPRVRQPALRQRRSDRLEADRHQPAFQRDQIQQGAGNGGRGLHGERPGTHSHQRQGYRRGIVSGKAGAAIPAVQSSRPGGRRRGRHGHRPGGDQAIGRTDGGRHRRGKHGRGGKRVLVRTDLGRGAPALPSQSSEAAAPGPTASVSRRAAAHPALCRGQPGEHEAGRATHRAAPGHAAADRA